MRSGLWEMVEVGSEVMVKLGSQVRDQVDSGTATSRLRDRNRWIVGGLPHSVLSEPTHALRLLTAVPWPLLAYFSPTSLISNVTSEASLGPPLPHEVPHPSHSLHTLIQSGTTLKGG